MKVEFDDFWLAVEFVSAGTVGENHVLLNIENGTLHYFCDDDETHGTPPQDSDADKYLAVPHKRDLGVEQELVLAFAYAYMPRDVAEVESLLRDEGALARWTSLLDGKNLLEKWQDYRAQAEEDALRAWCAEHGVELNG